MPEWLKGSVVGSTGSGTTSLSAYGGWLHEQRLEQVGAAEDEHGSDDEVGREGVVGEDDVRHRTPAGLDHLEEGVAVGRLALDLDGQDAEEQHLEIAGREIGGRWEGDEREMKGREIAGRWQGDGREMAERWHLDGRAGRVPEGAGDSEVPCDVGRLEEGRRPRPLRHNDLRGVGVGGHAVRQNPRGRGRVRAGIEAGIGAGGAVLR
eukprot:scaffold13227_cov40-Phaeocystis_antarctica.AAC.1